MSNSHFVFQLHQKVLNLLTFSLLSYLLCTPDGMCLYYCKYLTGFDVQRMHSRKNRQKVNKQPIKRH